MPSSPQTWHIGLGHLAWRWRARCAPTRARSRSSFDIGCPPLADDPIELGKIELAPGIELVEPVRVHLERIKPPLDVRDPLRGILFNVLFKVRNLARPKELTGGMHIE